MLEALREGSWVTRERVQVYSCILLGAFSLAIAAVFFTGHGPLDWKGRPIGTDFSQVWVAGVEVLEGHATAPWNNVLHYARQQDFFGKDAPFFGWHYPPYFLAIAALLALLPYLPALALWQIATLPLYLATILGFAKTIDVDRRLVLLAGLAFPAVFVNLGHGHNGFLTAALLGGGLLLLRDRPISAGALLACLAYKPQFALAIPVALLAGQYWRAALSAGVTGLVMTLATLWAFGLESWFAFRDSLVFTRTVIIEQGATGWEKIQSVFSAVRMVGGSLELAYAAQAVTTILVLAALFWLWRSAADFRLKAAALCIATQLTTPYCLDYDLVVLGPAIAALASHGAARGFAPYEKSFLVLVWMMPILARGFASLTHLPLGAPVMLALFALVLSRAAQMEATGERPQLAAV